MISSLAALLVIALAGTAPIGAPAAQSTAALSPSALEAMVAPQGGRVVLECVVQNQGVLADCAVIEETPIGHGLGKRALEASAKLKMDTPVVDGVAVTGMRVRIPFTFQL